MLQYISVNNKMALIDQFADMCITAEIPLKRQAMKIINMNIIEMCHVSKAF